VHVDTVHSARRRFDEARPGCYLAPGLGTGELHTRRVYDVTITNHGPNALTSATVVVALEQPVMGAARGCAPDRVARTLTCEFGPPAMVC
jgi:hypothetical protein